MVAHACDHRYSEGSKLQTNLGKKLATPPSQQASPHWYGGVLYKPSYPGGIDRKMDI
jgi:hypothetical protein